VLGGPGSRSKALKTKTPRLKALTYLVGQKPPRSKNPHIYYVIFIEIFLIMAYKKYT